MEKAHLHFRSPSLLLLLLLLLRLATWAVARPTTAFLPFPLLSPSPPPLHMPLSRSFPISSHPIRSLTHSHILPFPSAWACHQRGCTGLHFSARPAVALRFS